MRNAHRDRHPARLDPAVHGPRTGRGSSLSLVIAWLVVFGLAMVGAAGAAIFLLVALAT